jgi:O-antigen/teichoic acid export membrane protein
VSGHGVSSATSPARPRALPLRINFSWALAGNLVYAACQCGILIVLARVGNPELVGQYALALSVTVPVFLLTNLQLRAIQATDPRGEFAFADYLGLRLLSTPVALALLAGYAWASHYRPEVVGVLLLFALAKGLESLSDLCYGLFQQHERMDLVATSMIIKGPLGLFVLGAAVWLTANLHWAMIGLAAVWGLLFAVYDLRNCRKLLRAGDRSGHSRRVANAQLRPRWNRATLIKLTRMATPLGVSVMLLQLTFSLPNLVVEWTEGERALGIFAALAALTIAGMPVVGALAQSATPRMARLFLDGDFRGLRRLLALLMLWGSGIGLAGVAVAVVLGRFSLNLLYGPDYAEQTPLLIWLMLGVPVLYGSQFLGNAVTAMRCLRTVIVAQVAALATLIVGSAIAAPFWGTIGIAAALIACHVVRAIVLGTTTWTMTRSLENRFLALDDDRIAARRETANIPFEIESIGESIADAETTLPAQSAA